MLRFLDKSERILIDLMYREMFKKLWIYAKRQLEDDGLAEEAVQETFRIACEKGKHVLQSENPRGWIMKALKYTILTIKRDRAQLHKLYIHFEVEERETEITEEHVDLMYSDLVSEQDFAILKMIVLENRTIKDTAERFGLSINACKKRIQRIKERLQYILEEQTENGGERLD